MAATRAYDAHLSVTGRGPLLVLVPGMDGTGHLFYRQVPLLAKRYRVARYRLRDDAGSMAMLVQDLAVVIGTLSPAGEQAVVVGESFGGTVALSFALAHPELVARLVVINSFPQFRPQRRLRLAMFALRVMPWETMPLVRRFTAFRLHSRFSGRAELQRFLALTTDTTRAGYLDRLRILTAYDVRERLREIRSPTLFLAAEHDRLVPSVAQAEYMASRVPGARMQVLEGHGHICLIAPNLDLERILRDWPA